MRSHNSGDIYDRTLHIWAVERKKSFLENWNKFLPKNHITIIRTYWATKYERRSKENFGWLSAICLMHADISSKMTERSREEGSIFHFPKKSCLSSNISFLCHTNLFSTQWCTLRLTQGNIYIYFIFSWLTLYREGLNRQTESHVYIPLTLKVF